jgi:hypothetical protein
MFIDSNDYGITLFLPDFDRNQLASEKAGLMTGRPSLMAAQCKGVLILSINPELFGHAFSGFGHRVGPVKFLHPRIHEPPADSAVVDLCGATERGVGLGQNEWCAGHAFDPAGNNQIRFSGFDRSGPNGNGIQARTAQTVNSTAGYTLGEPSQQKSHSRHVAVILARLIRAAQDHIVDGRPIHIGIPVDQCADRNRGEIIRSD